MNFVTLTGGLGNQMFIYAFKVSLSKNNETALFHPNRSKDYGHAGYQLREIFNLEEEGIKAKWALGLFTAYWHCIRLFPKKVSPKLLKLVGIKEFCVPENFVFYEGIVGQNFKNTLFRGTWQSEKYFDNVSDQIRQLFSFKVNLINDRTKHMLDIIKSKQSPISIHVRRDDYLSSKYVSGFGGICTIEYYNKAVERIKEEVIDPVFYIFSDDINWCRENLKLEQGVFIDWNTGKESWQDMFLMSQCKHNIIANSSFSWWGAWLNSNSEKIVIAPRIWWNGLKDDVVPDSWIRI